MLLHANDTTKDIKIQFLREIHMYEASFLMNVTLHAKFNKHMTFLNTGSYSKVQQELKLSEEQSDLQTDAEELLEQKKRKKICMMQDLL